MKTLIALLALCFAAQATDIYVSPSGSGSGCSSGAPCSFSQGISNFSSGTAATIHAANGTYSNSPDIIKSGGSSSNRLILQCDNGTASALVAQGKCVFTNFWLIEGNHIDVIGFDIGNNPSASVAVDLVSNGGTTGNDVRVIGNYLHDMGSNVTNSSGVNGCPEAGMILAQTGVTGAVARRNFIKNYGKGFGFAYSGPGCNTAQGIYFANGISQDNILVSIPTACFQMSVGSLNVITNNVCIGTRVGIILEHVTGGLGNNTIANNWFGNLGVEAIFTQGAARCDSGHPNLYSHNISDGGKPDFGSTSGPFSCDIVTPNPWVHQSGALFFASYQTNGGGDYHLSSASAGIATGSTACTPGGTSPCTPSADFEGTALSTVAAIDVGAYKASGGTVSKPSPPTGLTAIVH